MSGLNRRAGIRARPEKKISLAGEFAEAIISRKKLRYPHFRVREWQWLVDLCFRKDTDCRRQSSAYAKKRKRRLKPRTPWLQDKECLTPLPWKGKERHQRICRAPGYSSNSNCGTGIAPQSRAHPFPILDESLRSATSALAAAATAAVSSEQLSAKQEASHCCVAAT